MADEITVVLAPAEVGFVLWLVLLVVISAVVVFFIARWWGKRVGYSEKQAKNLGWASLVTYFLAGFGGPIIIWAMAWFLKQG